MLNTLEIDGVEENIGALQVLSKPAFSISQIDAQNAEVVKISEDEICIISIAL